MFSKIKKEESPEKKILYLTKFGNFFLPLIKLIVKNMTFSIEQIVSLDEKEIKKKNVDSDDYDDEREEFEEKNE
jgi:hypothetical protein